MCGTYRPTVEWFETFAHHVEISGNCCELTMATGAVLRIRASYRLFRASSKSTGGDWSRFRFCFLSYLKSIPSGYTEFMRLLELFLHLTTV